MYTKYVDTSKKMTDEMKTNLLLVGNRQDPRNAIKLYGIPKEDFTSTFVEKLKNGLINPHDTDPSGWGYLHYCAFRNNVEAIEALIKAGADIELRTSSLDTPLFLAAFMDNLEASSALLKAGADPYVTNDTGSTLFYVVEFHKDERMIDLFKIEEVKKQIDIYRNEKMEKMREWERQKRIREFKKREEEALSQR